MNTATLVVLLATLAMYLIARYERRARSAEAVRSLNALGYAVANFYNSSDPNPAKRRFPPSSHGSVPTDLGLVRASRYKSDPSDWLDSPWRELGFRIDEPQSYAYSFESDGTGANATAVATARSDLDGDGRYSSFVLRIMPNGSGKAQAGELDRTDADE